MNVTKDVLYKKFQEIVPGLIKNLEPELLVSICDNKSVQPFLKWFVENVSKHNLLTEKELEIAKQIKKSSNWLSGEQLDNDLQRVLKDYSEIDEFLCLEPNDIDQPTQEYHLEKEEYTKDLEYLHFLQNQYKKLKNIEDKLEEQLENDEATLEKQQVEVEISYNKCTELLQHYNLTCQEFSTNLRVLLEMYNDINNKRNVYTWVQMPLEIFMKQLETYSNYLDLYIKNQFGDKFNFYKTEDNQFLNTSESENDEHMLNLPIYKNNLLKAKYNEIYNKVQKDAWKSSVQFLESLYNNGKLLQIPQNSNQFRTEIKEMLRRRDFMEENIEMLIVQLRDAAENFGEMEMNKFLVEVAQEKIECQKHLLTKLDNLILLARENGHAYSDLLCLLMSSQRLLITQLIEFAKNAQHHLHTEYSLAEKRCESMQNLQEEYNNILSSYTNEQNIFNKLFLNIMGCDHSIDIYKGIQEYESLINENHENRTVSLENKCISIIQNNEQLDKNMSKIYLEELDNGSTMNFQPMENSLISKLEETTTKVENCQSSFTTMHNKFKEIVKNINESSMEREKVILWQTFITAPNLLQTKYDDLKLKADKSHFKNNL